MTALQRLPAWATTGVGSLPFGDPGAAAAHATTAYDLPFCPQLPALDGDMVVEWLGADPARCGWAPDRDRERPRAWDAWLAALDAAPPAHRLVKLQVTGPVTLAAALSRAGGVAPPPTEIAQWLAANAAAQVAVLRDRGLDALLVVDEPGLGARHGGGSASAASAVVSAWDPLRSVAAAWGLHLCCAVDWPLVVAAAPDVLSFDLSVSPVDAGAAPVLEGIAARGGRVAWGVVRAHPLEHAPNGLLRLTAARMRALVPAEASLVSPACGSGRLSVRRERELAAACAGVALALRADVTGRAPRG